MEGGQLKRQAGFVQVAQAMEDRRALGGDATDSRHLSRQSRQATRVQAHLLHVGDLWDTRCQFRVMGAET